jgi:mRNA-degrading endonuclease RelE of RelBE toxin-antitoxin system
VEILQTNKFQKAYKKLSKSQLREVNYAIREVVENPLIGEQKIGNLSWLRVYKFRCLKQLVLLGYSLNEKNTIITFIDIGAHENFYRDLKNR